MINFIINNSLFWNAFNEKKQSKKGQEQIQKAEDFYVVGILYSGGSAPIIDTLIV